MLNYDVKTGRLTADPELRTTESGIPVLSFTLAVQRNYKIGDEYPVDFINFVAWRGTAEFISNHFHKGSLITVEGSLETRKYTDKDGNNRTAYEIKADRAHFGDSGNKQNNNTVPSSIETTNEFEPDFSGSNHSDEYDLPFGSSFPRFNN